MNKQNLNLTPAELAERLRLDIGTLANWRAQGKGPAYWKPSKRHVLYRVEAVEAWEASLTTKPKG